MRISVFVIAMLLSGSTVATDWDIRKFAECLSGSGAKYYGARWCPACKKQNKMFRRDKKYLPYVECSKKGSHKKLSRCSHIDVYPTWVFSNGKSRSGVLSFDTLARHTSCKLQEKNYFVD